MTGIADTFVYSEGMKHAHLVPDAVLDDVRLLITYTSRQWLPPNVKEAYDRVRAEMDKCALS